MSSPAVAACVTGSHTQQAVLQYAASSDLFWQTHMPIPQDITASSNLDFYVTWYGSPITGAVQWTIGVACVDAAATGDPTFTTSTFTATTVAGTTNQFNHSSKTGVTGCAAGKELYLQLERNAGAGTDTMSGTANAVSLAIVARRTITIGG